MPKFEDHDCSLPRPEDDVVKTFVDSGLFISCRRRLRSMCLVNKNHPETARFFKSHAACRSEEIRHLINYYYMIHPFSALKMYWEFYMFLLLTAHFTIIPIGSTLIGDNKGATYYYCKVLLELLYLFDVVKNFFTGYYDDNKNRVILSAFSIAKRYLKSYFFVDIISCIHLYLIILEFAGLETANQAVHLLKLFNRLKIVRLGRWLDQLELYRQYMGYSSYVFKGIRVVLVYVVLIFWGFSVYFFMKNYAGIYITGKEVSDWTQIFYESCYDATLMLLMVNFGKYSIHELVMYLNVVFFLCFGFILQLFLYAQVLQVWTKYSSGENKHYSLHKQFKEYMAYKKLPVGLRQRIMAYFQFKFHKHFFKESDITSMVSHSLKQEILLHVTKKHIEGVEFFKHLPPHILLRVVTHLKSEIFLPSDVIVSAGTEGTSMFFIHHGTVAVYSPAGKEICHLEDGDHFGEIALILSETRVANVVAVTASELFILKRTDFLSAIEPFPEVKENLIALATERLTKVILQDK